MGVVEDAEAFHAAVAAALASRDQVASRWVAAGLGRGDAVQSGGELASPVRLARCLARLGDQTSSGAVPLWRASASGERNRPTSAVSPRIFAAVSGRHPQTASNVGSGTA
jgi:hypothetical protein